MPRDVYETVKSRCHAILRELYVHVASPIDGPGKQDFGDIDILLACPKDGSTDEQEGLSTVVKALGATRCIVNQGASSNLALPWPTLEPTPTPERNSSVSGAEAKDKHAEERYIQVDIHIFSSVKEMEWMLFRHGHGDIWSILGSVIRPYGLTVDEGSLWLRVPEIERSNKNRAKVFLTSEPSEVFEFVGLPIGTYFEEPFQDAQAMYEYVAQCPMFSVPPSEPAQDRKGASADDLEKLKSNDRRRMKQRPAFRSFFDEFVVQCRSAGRFSERRTSREQITEEAFARFNIEAEFKARRDAFLLERQKETIWNKLIKDSIPLPQGSEPEKIMYRSCLVKALKMIILEDDDSYGVRLDEGFKDGDGFYLFENVIDFVNRYQDKVGEAAIQRHNARYAEHMQAKEAKEAQAQAQQQGAGEC
ncbi:hypothetical protein TOPH_07802 [Tolypocladium ophioglossoides CBS 100239]|uniref:Uncharacterized protein n=1 Tax=Tolypocladium ophioglossoides (strain CBS 100239) TaxID=1163406 RepID=A0A0L0N043_TOLOC|nr:hypothetical protein TOPH_07802 [Tolypocladium ophioglossoides CBS 100239]